MSAGSEKSLHGTNLKTNNNSLSTDESVGDTLLGTNLTAGFPPNSTDGQNLEVSVQFVGNPCQPDSKFFSVPPCNGPYSGYGIIIYAENGKTIVSRTITDSNGTAKMKLSPGSYLIYTRAGILPSDLKTNHFAIEKGKVTRLALFVDTGLE